MGFVFMVPSAYALYAMCMSRSGTSLEGKLLGFVMFEIVVTVFLLSLCAFIWGLSAPRWLEKLFHKAIRRLILTLAAISLILVGCALYIALFG